MIQVQIKVNLIVCEDKRSLIAECFASEEELYNKWHYKAGEGLEACIDATYNDVKDLQNYILYRMLIEDKTIGMFGIEQDIYLTGFFIKPEYRRKEIISEFMKLVNSKLKNTWCVGLYNKNTRAIDFLTKNGAVKTFELMKNNQAVSMYTMFSGEL